MMVKAVSSPILQLIRWAGDNQRVRDLSDQELLQRFDARQDQAAFHALLRRHGPMVLDVCRSVLGHEPDAEDAFQATFLILVRKAGSIRKVASLASWLHGVARRTALKARAQSATRHKYEGRAPIRQAAEADDLSWREVRQILHEELSGLPERYQAPLLLCSLEGVTQEVAARKLNLAKSTLRQRLERGRALLRARLIRRGLGPAALPVAVAWPAASAPASVPFAVVSSTVKAASLIAAGPAAGVVSAGVVSAGVVSAEVAALTEGVLKTMLPSRLRLAAGAVLLVAALGGGTGIVFQSQAAQHQGRKADADNLPGGARKNPAPKNDEKRLQGTWKVVSMIDDGVERKGAVGLWWAFSGKELKAQFQRRGRKSGTATSYLHFRLNESMSPKAIDLVEAVAFVEGEDLYLFDQQGLAKRLDDADARKEGIYSIVGTTLKICFSRKKGDRPTAFASERGSDRVLIVLHRAWPKGRRIKGLTTPTPKGGRFKDVTAPVGAAERDAKQFEGNWKVLMAKGYGLPEGHAKKYLHVVIRNKRLRLRDESVAVNRIDVTFRLAKPWERGLPKRIDLTYAKTGETVRGIYMFHDGGKALTIVYNDEVDDPRPSAFVDGGPNGGNQLLLMRREEKGKPAGPTSKDGTKRETDDLKRWVTLREEAKLKDFMKAREGRLMYWSYDGKEERMRVLEKVLDSMKSGETWVITKPEKGKGGDRRDHIKPGQGVGIILEDCHSKECILLRRPRSPRPE